MSAYKILRGVSYGNKRAEVGVIVTDLPESSVKWLLASGVIEPAEAPQPAKPSKPKSEPVSDSKGDE